MKAQVMITHRVVGFHHWPQAEGDVAYLANRHRHLFFLIVCWEVQHMDRQVEFHTAQAWVRDTFEEPKDFGAKSCEMIARYLAEELVEAGHPPPSWVEVWEDEECGARVEFDA